MESLEARRLLADGDYDTSFGGSGQKLYQYDDARARDVAILADGTMLVAASSSNGFRVLRLQSNGSLDATFGAGGVAAVPLTTSGSPNLRKVLVQADGKVLLVGHCNNTDGAQYPNLNRAVLVRLTVSGALDTSFDGDGIAKVLFSTTSHFSVGGAALQADGKIVVGGWTGYSSTGDFIAARFLDNGALDTSFDGDGLRTVPFDLIANGDDVVTDVAVQTDGKVVLAGHAAKGLNQAEFALARLTTSGALDTTFDFDGKRTIAFNLAGKDRNVAQGLALQADGKIIVAGYADNGAIAPKMVAARLTTAGALDPAFNGTGTQVVGDGQVFDVAIQHDGKVALAGSWPRASEWDFALARLKTDGTLDTSFRGTGLGYYDFYNFLYYSSDAAAAVVYQADGKIVVVGGSTLSNANHDTRMALLRLHSTPPPAPTTTTLSVSASSLPYGSPLTLTVNVTPGTGPGVVSILDGATLLGTADVILGRPTDWDAPALAAGVHQLTARFEGNTAYQPSTSAVQQVTITGTTTTTALDVSAPSVSFGQAVTFTATVSPTGATGSVRFSQGTTTLATVALNGGTATYQNASWNAGTYQVTATYLGDATYSASTSPARQVVVAPLATTIGLTAAPTSSQYGEFVTFTASVAPVSADGLVAFLEGATTLVAMAHSGGAATYRTRLLGVGPHSIKARLLATQNHLGADSPVAAIDVQRAATTTGLTVPASPVPLGDPVSLSATVTSANIAPTGQVEFLDDTTVLATSPLNGGTATALINGLAVGTHRLSARFVGQATHAASTSETQSLVVGQNVTTTRLESSASPGTLGQPLTLTVTVTSSAGPPEGAVTLRDGATTLGTSALTNGVARWTIDDLTPGQHTLKAAYEGAASFAVSDAALDLTIQAPTTTTLTLPNTPVRLGESAVFAVGARHALGPASGVVALFEGAAKLGEVALVQGAGTIVVPALGVGPHTLIARFVGGPIDLPSASDAVAFVVQPATSTTTLLVEPAGPVRFGQAVTLRADVSSSLGAVAGDVAFLAGETIVATVALNAGVAVWTTTTLPVGDLALRARFVGSNALAASDSVVQTLRVQPVPYTAITGLSTTVSGGAVTSLVLRLNGPVQEGLARGVSNYTLAYAGRDRKFGTRDDVRITLGSAAYDARRGTITLKPRSRLTLSADARLLVDRLRDLLGRLVDGNRDGKEGGAFTAVVKRPGSR